jgi:hybrid polyketide synthase / nonribosomal peptide synthetase FtdB
MWQQSLFEGTMQNREAVAIIGVGCRFPGGAHGPENYWRLLSEGRDLTSDLPESRCNPRRFYDPNPHKPGRMHVMHGGFLDAIDLFDHEFFGISPREADYLDPQQRLLLETAWEAFEDGGLIPGRYAGKAVGVFVGAFTLDYKILQFSGSHLDGIGVHTATGSMMTMCSNRLSYVFDFRGPSLSIDTACSSSLVATHYACRSLLAGECELALAGGVMLIATPHYLVAESKGGFLSPDGHCKTFTAAADGYARGEGAGIVILKRLSAAERDGDRILAVIRGSGVNQDGRTPGITVPSGEQQLRLLERVYAEAGIPPSAIHYVEAHGTGTAVGDPIEATALGTFFARDRAAGWSCLVGSVKSNMGHLESAAGIAGLIKATLMLHHRQIPPHLHFGPANPKIDFAGLQLRVPTCLEQWPESAEPPYVGVNSFGFGGTNAHVVLEGYLPAAPTLCDPVIASGEVASDPVVIPISARGEDGLRRVAETLAGWIEGGAADGSLRDLAVNLACRRSHHDWRLGVVATSRADLARQLRSFVAGEQQPTLLQGRSPGAADAAPRLCFVYTGNGPQWWAMGRQLYHSQPVFRAAIDRCDRELRRYTDWSLCEELSRGEADHRMDDTSIAQPANFAIQYALSELLSSWGIEPTACIGHSTGEVASFWKAGVLSFADAIYVTYQRSRLQQQTAGKGTLVAVGLSHAEAERLVREEPGRVSIAGINAPNAITLAGDNEAMARIVQRLEAVGTFCRQLRVNVPFHSPIMDEIRAAWEDVLTNLRPRPATRTLYVTATGMRAVGPELDAEYWWRNVRDAVRFQDCFELALDDGYSVFLEVGPHPVLAAAMRECASSCGRVVTLLHSLYRNRSEDVTIACAVAGLYATGSAPQFERLYGPTPHLDLPLYPFARERCWAEPAENRRFRIDPDEHPMLGRRLATAAYLWEVEINCHWNPFLADHVIENRVLFPAAGYLEQVAAAVRGITGGSYFTLEDVVFHRALFIAPDEDPRVQVHLDPRHGSFTVASVARGDAVGGTLHAEGRFRQLQPPGWSARVPLDELRGRCPQVVDQNECYAGLAGLGFHYGPQFRGLEEVFVGHLESLARLVSPGGVAVTEPQWVFHPVVLDAALQAMIVIELAAAPCSAEVRLPVGIGRVTFMRPASALMWAHARVVQRTDQETIGEIAIYDADGWLAVTITGFCARAIAHAGASVKPRTVTSWLYRVDWQEEPLAASVIVGGTADTCLLFAPRSDEGVRLKQVLESRGSSVVMVRPGACFEYHAGGAATLNMRSAADYTALFDALQASGRVPNRIIHLWGLDAPATEGLTIEDLAGWALDLLHSALYLSQAVVQRARAARLWVVTRGAQFAGMQPLVTAVAAPLWGLGRVFGQQEHVGQWGGLIDLDRIGGEREITALADEVLADTLEDQVALRGPDATRKVMRINRAGGLYDTLPLRFRPDGAYVVTGAFGALGQLIAEWLAERGAGTLILIARSSVPPREQWARLAADDPAASRVAVVQRLEQRGARVLCAAMDCADTPQLERFLADYHAQRQLPVRGVFHCAGVVADAVIEEVRSDDLVRPWVPKVMGGWNLHQVLRDEPLEHFVLFSSVASLVTSTGQAAYAAANAFLDALAQYRRQLGRPALSINWGPWAIGMVRELDLLAHYQRRGMPPMHPAAALAALERVLVQDLAQVAVAEAEWPTVMQFYPRAQSMIIHLAQELSREESPSGDANPRQRLLDTLPERQEEVLLDELSNLVVRVLRIRRSGIVAGIRLTTLGLDSMLAIELRNRIELAFGASVSVVDLLGDLSMEELAGKLLVQVLQQQERASAEMTAVELAGILARDPGLTTQLSAELGQDTTEGLIAVLLDDAELQTQFAALVHSQSGPS